MRRLLAAVAAALVLTGCGRGPDLGDVPMPQIVSGPTYTIDVLFESALNLPRQAPVKLGGETVGEVVSVEAVDYRAKVRLRITEATRIPADTRAEVRLSAPIGESFVALIPPSKPTGAALLTRGATIDLAHTRAAPDTTDLLTTLSVAITGGSYADLKTVVSELTTALDGNSAEIRHLFEQLDLLVTDMNTHRNDLDVALDGLDRLSSQLATDADSLVTSGKTLTPAIQELAKQQDAAMDLLTSVTRLGKAGTRVIKTMSTTLGQQLRDASTLLDTVVDAQGKLEPTLAGIAGFAKNLDDATPGDYTMFDLTIMTDPTITGLPFVNLDGSSPIQVPEIAPLTLPKLPFIGEIPLSKELTDLLNGLINAGGGK